MKVANNIAPSVIALYYLMLGCSSIYFPFTEGTATCSGGKIRSAGRHKTARDQVFGDLIKNTFYAPNSQYCTWYTAGGTCTVYGMANCVMSSNHCGGNFCANTYDQCWTCLTTARDRLAKECGKKLAGYAVVKDEQQVFQCSLQFTNQHLCS